MNLFNQTTTLRLTWLTVALTIVDSLLFAHVLNVTGVNANFKQSFVTSFFGTVIAALVISTLAAYIVALFLPRKHQYMHRSLVVALLIMSLIQAAIIAVSVATLLTKTT